MSTERDALIESYERMAHAHRLEVEELRREVERLRRDASRTEQAATPLEFLYGRLLYRALVDSGGLRTLSDELREEMALALGLEMGPERSLKPAPPITKPDSPRAIAVEPDDRLPTGAVEKLRRILGEIDDLACKSGPISGTGEEEPDPLNPDGQEIAEHCREALALLPVDF